MRYLSMFSGIEAASVAWHPLGWECVGVAEIEPFPCAVLAHHYPDVPNLGSVTDITDEQIAALGPFDLVVGGSPCQDLSVAGKRAGLAGARSGLFHEQLRIFHAARTLCGARWLLWENVPGAFSSHGGQDFAVVVGAMAGTGFAVPKGKWQKAGVAVGSHGLVEWRTLDAQYVRVESHPRAVPQRRRRVFALLDTGDWTSRPPILLEPESLRGDSPPRRETGEVVAGCLTPGAHPGGFNGQDAYENKLITEAFGGNRQSGPIDVATAVNAHGGPMGRMDFESETFLVQPPVAFHNRQDPDVSGPVTHPLGAQTGVPVAFSCKDHGGAPSDVSVLKADAAKAGDSSPHVLHAMQVRRLTPRECERLQGFPDDYTLILYRGKPAADGNRYKALGNSFAVNVLSWIGSRLDQVSRTESE